MRINPMPYALRPTRWRLIQNHAAATLEYIMLIVIILGVAVVSRDFISRAIFGKWKSSMDSISYGRQYDPQKTLECAFDPPTGIWYDVKCAAAIICAPSDTACLFSKVNQCSPACIDNENPPICAPRTVCLEKECGDVDDNCGGILSCPLECPNSGDQCNLATHQCECAPTTTCSPGDCGDVPNGCSTGTFPCPSCSVGTCINNKCCVPQATCNPEQCGNIPAGCNAGTLPCGDPCPPLGKVCFNNQCCVPKTTCNAGQCGDVPKGCGLAETLSCGGCPAGQQCNASHQCECAPKLTCNPGDCGNVSDNCGGTLPCGSCPVGICISNQCCVPRTTCNPGECEDVDDGCQGILSCPSCPPPQICTIDAFGNHQCCTLESDADFCSRLGIQCGPASGINNCWQPWTVAECGPCSGKKVCSIAGQLDPCPPPPQSCSIVGQQCCNPEGDAAFCSRLGIQCGEASGTDNCGWPRTVPECGPCSGKKVCSIPDQQCCSPESDADFCSKLGIQCGQASGTDNCGISRTVTECGPCPFITQVCSSTQQCCVPQATCNPGQCGDVPDGCQGTLSCGFPCATQQVCSVANPTLGIIGNQCCNPESDAAFCSGLGKNCGDVTANDNCGTSRTVNCGTCTLPETCGGGGTDNVCGCTPTTCAPENCGTIIDDGCGGTIDCGSCCGNSTCGSGEDCLNCPEDCGGPCCGNGSCNNGIDSPPNAGENNTNCPQDCNCVSSIVHKCPEAMSCCVYIDKPPACKFIADGC